MNWFYNLKIVTKLAVSFLIVLILMLGMGLFSIVQLSQLNRIASVNIIQEWMPNVIAASDMNTNITNLRNNAFQHIMAPSMQNMNDLEKKMQDDLVKFAKNTKDYEVWISSDAERAIYDDFKNKWAAYMQAHNKVIALSRENKDEEAKALIVGESEQLFGSSIELLYKIIKTNVDGSDKSGKEAQAAYESSRLWISAILAGTVVLGLLLAFFISRVISGAINTAVTVASTVAAGDLTSRIDVTTRDETGKLMQSLKDMNEKLYEIVSNIRSGVDSITTGAKQIATGNADLSQRTEEQASSLEETASSMEELTSTVKQNADNAKQANQLAVSASDVAVKGGQVVGEVVKTMASISDSSKKIVDIISVIEGIAFQTNILALNAAVEAARAGEQGRGFAVVAAEVRNLAQRSAAAAKEIKSLIGDSVDKVGAGTKLVDQAGITMNEIVTAVKRVTDLMSEIAAASNEQSAGIEQVNTAITQMDEVTQQNAALVEEAAAAAESMEEQASILMEAVSVFKLEGGSKHQRVAAKPVLMHKAAPVREATLHLPTARKDRKLTKGKDQNEGDWKEF